MGIKDCEHAGTGAGRPFRETEVGQLLEKIDFEVLDQRRRMGLLELLEHTDSNNLPALRQTVHGDIERGLELMRGWADQAFRLLSELGKVDAPSDRKGSDIAPEDFAKVGAELIEVEEQHARIMLRDLQSEEVASRKALAGSAAERQREAQS